MISFKKQTYATADQEKQVEAGCRAYYLVSDSTAHPEAAQAKPDAPPAAAAPTGFASAVAAIRAQFAQMTAQQQVAALDQMTNTTRQIMQTLSPQAQALLRAQNTEKHGVAVTPALPNGSK
jgi:hypothetical protein